MQPPVRPLPALLRDHALTDARSLAGAADRWTALDAGEPVVVAVTDVRSAVHAARLRRRAEALTAVRHPGVARVRRLVELPGDRVALVLEEVPGTDLRTLRAGRPPGCWDAGQVAGLVAALAEALAALHAAGLVHGDVAAANVVVTPAGEPVLVDLGWGDDPAERGTASVAAPERRGAPGRAPRATPAGDVHAVARLGLDLLGPAAEKEAALATLLTDATATDPAQRPSASGLAAAVREAVAVEPLTLPEPAVLVGSLLRGRARDPERTVRTAARPRGRHRRRRGRPWLRAAAVPVAAAALTGVAMVAGVLPGPAGFTGGGPPAAADVARPTPRGAGPDTGAVGPVQASADPAVVAAVRLTHQRARALVDGRLLALLSVTTPGSTAAGADLRAWRDVRAAGLRGRAVVVVEEARRVDDVAVPAMEPPGRGTGPHGGHAPTTPRTVEVRLVMGAASADGATRPPPPVRPVLLELVPADDGGTWAVSAVRPGT